MFAQNEEQNNLFNSYQLKPKKNQQLAWIGSLYLRGFVTFPPTPSRLTPEMLENIQGMCNERAPEEKGKH